MNYPGLLKKNEELSLFNSGSSRCMHLFHRSGLMCLYFVLHLHCLQNNKTLTGLDSFRLEGTEGEEIGIRATIEKRLNERMAVRGVFSLGDGPNTSEAQGSYQLTDWLDLVGTQKTDGNYAVDIRLRLVGD